ncbi:hypothetical protein HZC09_06370 [Candidatus Micrarchaeota archaeon]|nr:hypothetical protein [Candidatus Micrarchaeota archaeon]
MRSKKSSANSNIALGAVIASVVLFGLTQHVIFALTTIACVIAAVYFETKESKNWLKDMAHNLGSALLLWAALTFLFNSAVPLNIITSCSMLPDYERGDMILLGGYFFSAPTVKLNKSLENADYETYGIRDELGNAVGTIMQPTVSGTPLFNPKIGVCDRKYSGRTEQELCLKNIEIGGQVLELNKSNSIVVFDSRTEAGQIIHRAYALLEAADGAYLLTRGDNNNFLDQQLGFKLIRLQEDQRVIAGLPFIGGLTTRGWKWESELPLKGTVLLRIPYLGYIKLFMFMQIAAPAGCDSVLQH